MLSVHSRAEQSCEGFNGLVIGWGAGVGAACFACLLTGECRFWDWASRRLFRHRPAIGISIHALLAGMWIADERPFEFRSRERERGTKDPFTLLLARHCVYDMSETEEYSLGSTVMCSFGL